MNITLDEIRSKAPEGATVYKEYFGQIVYFKECADGIYIWDIDRWCKMPKITLASAKPLN